MIVKFSIREDAVEETSKDTKFVHFHVQCLDDVGIINQSLVMLKSLLEVKIRF